MFLRTLLMIALGALVGIGCNKKADLDSEKAKYSYAIGHQIGRNLKAQNVEVDKAALQQALQDALADKEPALNQEERLAALQGMAKQREKKRTKDAAENKKKGEAFLEENKKKDGVKVTDSGLQYKVVKEGSGEKPGKGDVVTVHYKGTLIDGEVFDSSYKRDKPAEFPVSAVIPGWTEALQMMKKGAEWELYIPSELAYGKRGNPNIPGNSVLVFEVELLDIKKK